MTQDIHPNAIKGMIAYYYLVAFCPPAHISELVKASEPLRKQLTKLAGLKMPDFVKAIAPEVAYRICAFQGATREPDKETVEKLGKAILTADTKPEKTAEYQTLWREVAAHRGRAKESNRLHRQKGCSLCQAPCQYGFFTLISEPDFKTLLAMLGEENKKIAGERNPVNVLWTYTTTHLWKTLGTNQGFISADHLGNLAYCLLMLGTAKSRYPMAEEQLTRFQEMNQEAIRSWQPARIEVGK
jgi:ribosomal protein L24E